ncbi:MAG: OsmC family protein [Gemmatimonadota bacterium]|nr:OsmC family protein [Gemmatimonadota bacterium]
MSSSRNDEPSTRVVLHWTGEGLSFTGGPPDGPTIRLESGGKGSPSPTHLLLLSLAGCMGVDLVMILEKSRVPVESLEVRVDGWRVQEPPRRFEAIRLVYRIAGPAEEDEAKLRRAVDLSREKYCSVLHTLRSDVDLTIDVERA